ncbi:MAG: 4Fe-4S dicluster domain-containing protein [Chloroflexota bacterium]
MKRVYVKESVCIGCRLCEVYCQLAYSQSEDLIKAFKKESPRSLPRVRVEVNSPVSFSVRCQHCSEPSCVYACLTGALQKDPESGIVTIDEERCMNCGTCILVCPLAAIKRDTQQGKMLKCDLCSGKDMPVCVAKCPNEALVYEEAKEAFTIYS